MADRIPGPMPQAGIERAPWALNTPQTPLHPATKFASHQIDKVVHFGDVQEVRSAEKYSRTAANRDQHHERVLPIRGMWMPGKEKR
jgi:hypothetical protein